MTDELWGPFSKYLEKVDSIITGVHCSIFLSGYESIQIMSDAFNQCFMSGVLKQSKFGSGNDKVSLLFVLGSFCCVR